MQKTHSCPTQAQVSSKRPPLTEEDISMGVEPNEVGSHWVVPPEFAVDTPDQAWEAGGRIARASDDTWLFLLGEFGEPIAHCPYCGEKLPEK